ncbi:DUF3265 domain-containing protein [Vibrio vulnificus]|nr:DUF3265 domain-containing protein [Vibrio vulnificus]EHU4868723.1 DUF3265 domain-containing protein [Vibrio vulnificus]EHV9037581.1 DUF3265 domain-containing protein [Vibrio vulnificus]EHV9590127.1 DUF3265 domain-containing protein [Vibrio vulnificus]EHZ2722180.1 DUF3265 domain-containing protein [Vibrio vulnificus]
MIRHAWHFYYALILVIKVVCGSVVLRASHLNWALGQFNFCERNKNGKYRYSRFLYRSAKFTS